MSQYFRFRTAERLLGRPASETAEARPGELDELSIYFASPEELNDPLEGHRETCFSGDLIVWKNLIKHYTVMLYEAVIDRYAGENKGLMHINLSPSNFHGESRGYLETAINSVQSCAAIRMYLEALTSVERTVSRVELSAHLATLHSTILSYILEVLENCLNIHEAQMYKQSRGNFQNYIFLRSNEIRTAGQNSNIQAYVEIKDKFKQQAIRACVFRDQELDPNALRLFANFPEEFSTQLDYLMYPRWYVACFMKSCSNSAIWGSYGDNHKGVCLIYSSDVNNGKDSLLLRKLPFPFVQGYHFGRPKHEYYLNMPLSLPLVEVKYKPEYYTPNFFDSILTVNKDWAMKYWYTDKNGDISRNAASMYQKPSAVWPVHKEQFLRSCTNKTAHWENETEARIILSGIELTREERLVNYSFHQLEGIIFGIKTPDAAKIKIIKKISDHCKTHRRSDFKFYQAKFDSKYEEIEYVHLKYITYNSDGTLNLDPQLPS
ncbi:DUF2971 domain-containing protein [Pseudomonas putida]|uniref:DUF2971 domain-containing protein n=1 Tax=Pseudomonas putida TaxID=303 RepID=UPI003905FF02